MKNSLAIGHSVGEFTALAIQNHISAEVQRYCKRENYLYVMEERLADEKIELRKGLRYASC